MDPDPIRISNSKWKYDNLQKMGLRGHRHLTENHDLRSWDKSPGHAGNFSTPDCKKIIKAPSVRVMVICSDQNFYDSDKGVDRALTSNESMLEKTIILSKARGSLEILYKDHE